jgi:hypothetical protein
MGAVGSRLRAQPGPVGAILGDGRDGPLFARRQRPLLLAYMGHSCGILSQQKHDSHIAGATIFHAHASPARHSNFAFLVGKTRDVHVSTA